MTYRLDTRDAGPNPIYWSTLEELLSSANIPITPNFSYTPFAEVVPTLGGGKFGRGFSVATWHLDGITASQRYALRQICPGLSITVYVETPTNEVDSDGEIIWIQAAAVMNWTEGEEDRDANGVTMDVDVQFTELVEV